MAEEYTLSTQADRTDAEKLGAILFAITTARDKVRGVEEALINRIP